MPRVRRSPAVSSQHESDSGSNKIVGSNDLEPPYVDDLSVRDQSMRVMYEDPGQRDEKKRLLRLLKGQSNAAAGARVGDAELESETLSTPSSSKEFERKTRKSIRIASCS